ncbi:MAG TPA: hypothetical protein VD973_10530 [Symbiobacteriaceae bacterium]|nr:hypothetical protein [Symbiobacteriaceae bacterium]
MNDVERLLQQDRMAGVPEPPDLRYTEAAVRRRLGRAPGAKGTVAAQSRWAASAVPRSPVTPSMAESPDWWMAAAALALIAPLAWLLPYIGLSPWWLMAMPLALLPLAPLLVMKERDRS